MEENKNEKNKIFHWLIGIAILLGVWGFANPFIIGWYFKDKSGYEMYKDFGPVGDWIGGSSTPIITLASFIILIAAFLAQKQELQSTREELNLTRKEFKDQNTTLSKQRFENTFFHLVTLHHDIVNSIEHTEEVPQVDSYTKTHYITKVLRGRAYLSEISKTLYSQDWTDIFTTDQLLQKYYRIYEENQSILGHFFRNLYHIVKFIDESEELSIHDTLGNNDVESVHERKKYIRIIRAQLSTPELLLIFYNSMTTEGSEFLKLVKKYKLLNNLDEGLIPKSLKNTFKDLKQQ